MARYHVKADGSMGDCTAKEGHCPFGGDSGTRHFTSESEARSYAEGIIKNTTDGGMKMTKTKDEEPTTIPTTDDDEPRMTTNLWGLKVTTWPTTEHGCHSATYLGWGGDDVIINSGGYVNGVYVPASEVWGLAGLFDKLSEDVRDEMPDPDGCDPAEWNDRILEIERGGVSPEDEKLLDALWIEAESFEGSVTIYGRDDDVAGLDEDDFRLLGMRRLTADELWHLGIIVDDDEDDDEDEDE